MLASRPCGACDDADDKAVRLELLVKWEALPFAEASWEASDSFVGWEGALEAYEDAQARPCVPPPVEEAGSRPEEMTKLDDSPTFSEGRTLRPYQLEGVNWLLSSWAERRNVMLADKMGGSARRPTLTPTLVLTLMPGDARRRDGARQDGADRGDP